MCLGRQIVIFFVSNKGKRISKLEKAAKNFVVEIYSVGK